MGNYYLKRAYYLIFLGSFCCLGTILYSQGTQSDKNPAKGKSDMSVAETPVPATDAPSDIISESTEMKPAEAETPAEVVQPRIYTNPALQGRVNEQYRWTPEDPSFLYETRNIPDHKNDQEFLPAELEKVEIRERIREEVDFRKSLGKIKIRLPDMTQTLILVGIIIIVLIYRNRARRQHDSRR